MRLKNVQSRRTDGEQVSLTGSEKPATKWIVLPARADVQDSYSLGWKSADGRYFAAITECSDGKCCKCFGDECCKCFGNEVCCGCVEYVRPYPPCRDNCGVIEPPCGCNCPEGACPNPSIR